MTKLDIGCGSNKKEGFTGIDISPDCGADIVHDVRVTPWPFNDGEVEEIHCSHFFEHLTGAERMVFMNEAYRVLKPEGKMAIITPHWTSVRSVQDPTHQWPPVAENTYLYFNKKWREDNKLTHYPITCDFDFGYGYSMDGEIQVRNQEFQMFALKHYNNAVMDLHVTLIRRA